MSRQALFFISLCVFWATAHGQSQPIDGESPEKLVERLWMDGTSGYLLTPEGLDQASRDFVHFADQDRNKPLFVISNYWGLSHSKIYGDKATVEVEFNPVGYIDSKLRFKPSTNDDPCALWQAMLYNLALRQTYSVTYRSEGGKMTSPEKKPTGHMAWQITDPA